MSRLTLSDLSVKHQRWARAFSLFNPHATVKILDFDGRGEHANFNAKTEDFYQGQALPATWRKFLPTDLPSAWWFNLKDFEALVYAHIAHDDLSLRDFVKQFRGLTSTARIKAVAEQFQGISRMAELEQQPQLISRAAPGDSATLLRSTLGQRPRLGRTRTL